MMIRIRLRYRTWTLRALCVGFSGGCARDTAAVGMRVEYIKTPDLATRKELGDQTWGRHRKLGANQARKNKQYQATLGGCRGRRECGATRRSPLGPLGMTHLKNNITAS
jgi:hypothetical protein